MLTLNNVYIVKDNTFFYLVTNVYILRYLPYTLVISSIKDVLGVQSWTHILHI